MKSYSVWKIVHKFHIYFKSNEMLEIWKFVVRISTFKFNDFISVSCQSNSLSKIFFSVEKTIACKIVLIYQIISLLCKIVRSTISDAVIVLWPWLKNYDVPNERKIRKSIRRMKYLLNELVVKVILLKIRKIYSRLKET